MSSLKYKNPATGEWEKVGLCLAAKHAPTHAADGNDPITPEMIGARADDWMPSAEDVGAAPAGYGLGVSSFRGKYLRTAEEVDAFVGNGWATYANDNTPLVSGVPQTLYVAFQTFVFNDNTKVQYGFIVGGGSPYEAKYDIRRYMQSGVWQPWEWVNPPMALGVEYRTTERYLGKPVYVEAVNFGSLPNSTSKTVAHNIPNIAYVISADAIAYNTSAGVPEGIMNTNNHVDYFNVSPINITICTKNAVSQLTITVNMKYTKTTD